MKVSILGVNIDNVTMEETLERVEAFLSDGQKHQIVTVNPEFVVTAQKDSEFRRILNSVDLAIPDGIGLVLASRLIRHDRSKLYGAPLRERVAGRDLIEQLASLGAKRGFKIYLLGGEKGVAKKAAEILRNRYPRLKIVGAEEGLPAEALSPSAPLGTGSVEGRRWGIIKEINRVQPDFLFVAYGAPKQDKWIAKNLAELNVKVAMGVGGALDMIAGITPRAPLWMRRLGLEWLWRLFLEPKKRLPRIFRAVIIFPLLVLLDEACAVLYRRRRMGSWHFTDSQLKALSDIFADIGQVCFASMVVPFLVSGLDSRGAVMLTSGLILAFLFWSASILSVRRIK